MGQKSFSPERVEASGINLGNDWFVVGSPFCLGGDGGGGGSFGVL